LELTIFAMRTSPLLSKFASRSSAFSNQQAIGVSSLRCHQQAKQTMKLSSTVALSMLFGSVSAFSPSSTVSKAVQSASFSSVAVKMGEKPVFDQEQYIEESKEMRLKHLEEQAMFALKIAAENYGYAFLLCSRCTLCCIGY
jgi:hypothetical protein